MLFEELVMHNFGVYKGRHSINLIPETENKPIILFGALNGGGKTTFLDALQLALYGKFSNCSNRGNLGYLDYLKQTINHHVDSTEGAGIELQFRHKHEGKEDTIRIIRTWRSTGKGIKEIIEVLRNGQFDPLITDRWYEYVEEFIPSQISSLFFFDGEKIESLASPEKSSELIRTGLHALLGLDLVDRIFKDLRVVETKRRKELKTKDEQKKLSELHAHIKALKDRYSELREKNASERTELQMIENQVKRLRDNFKREGGELLEQRDSIETEIKATQKRLEDAEEKLRELAAGAAPLLLARDLLNSTHSQALHENEARLHKELRRVLASRDRSILDALKRKDIDESVLVALKTHMQTDLKKRDRNHNDKVYLHIEPTAFAGLSDEAFKELQLAITKQTSHTENISEHLDALKQKIAGIPDPEALEGITEKLEKTNNSKNRAQLRIESLDHELNVIDKQIKAREEEYLRHLERTTNQEFTDETNQRILKHSKKLQATFTRFRQRAAEKHIAQLEFLILESFQNLVRKADLVSHIEIKPETYQIILYNNCGAPLPPQRLSAGERQLLAVSILWGLAKASGRPLPTVVDTPLGRLDGEHRTQMVKNYFPYAGHQVLLLSTDEEIDEHYYKNLKSYVGREYLIKYDEKLSSSEVKPGYFC